MRKTVLTAVAAGALLAAGAASAEGLGEYLGKLFGYGTPHVSGPIEVMGPQPPMSTVYLDQQGRQVAIDVNGQRTLIAEAGRPMMVSTNEDSDRDGIANTSDRWPFDRRYW